MGLLVVVLLMGLVLTARWSGAPYQPWRPAERDAEHDAPRSIWSTLRGPALRYLRGVSIGWVAGFWVGLLVTGPAVRLIMRLLAVTAGDEAQGRITEADEIVGKIDLGGTVGLLLFGGVLPGLLSGVLYVLIRRWLPAGRLGGVAFGLLHLVTAATRIDPLRPDNVDFDLVGPGWLSAVTFGAAAVVHGMAVAAFANRFSAEVPPVSRDRVARTRTLLPAVPPALLLIPLIFALLPIVGGLVVAVALAPIGALERLTNSPRWLLAGRIALLLVALVLLPGAVLGVRDVIFR